MMGRQAKVLSRRDLRRLLAAAADGKFASRDQVIVLLATRAGLRACEIARLTWGMLLDADGRIGTSIEVRDTIAKRGAGRRVPAHPQLRKALKALRAELPPEHAKPDALVVRSLRGGAMRPNSIVNWFVAHCRAAGLEGCSSHSGRRTFITNAARNLHRVGASLRDVQVLAGHRSIETTQVYIDGDSHAQRRLVAISH
jgi:integrase